MYMRLDYAHAIGCMANALASSWHACSSAYVFNLIITYINVQLYTHDMLDIYKCAHINVQQHLPVNGNTIP